MRYYDRKDDTPTLAFANYVYADNGTVDNQPLTREANSYSKLNVEDDLKWQLNRTWTFGGGYFFERFVFRERRGRLHQRKWRQGLSELDTMELATWRSSMQYSQRRYNTWLVKTATDPAAARCATSSWQNCNRTKSNTVVELAAFKNVTISPNGGCAGMSTRPICLANAAPVAVTIARHEIRSIMESRYRCGLPRDP